MQPKNNAFTLTELMVVVLIVTVLCGIVAPVMRGKIDSSKWSEANAAAGMIRSAVRIYCFENSTPITGSMSSTSLQNALGITAGDLEGGYFRAADYTIDSVDPSGYPTITVTGSKDNAPSGTRTMSPSGDWQ